jgi:hypothetical protein
MFSMLDGQCRWNGGIFGVRIATGINKNRLDTDSAVLKSKELA